MALEKQIVNFALAKGVDTKSDPKQLVFGALTVLENARFNQPGRIRKRAGFQSVSQDKIGGGNAIDKGVGVASLGNELLMSTGTELYSYTDGIDRWSDKGDLYNITIDTQSVIKNAYDQTSQNSCYHPSGLQAFVWEDSSGGSRYSIIDYATKMQIVSNVLLASTAVKPKAFAVGPYLVLTYYETSGSDLKALCIPAATPTSGTSLINLAIDPVNNVYDAAIIGTRLYFVYNNTSGNISTRYLNTNLTVSAARTLNGIVATTCTIFGDSALNVFIAFHNLVDIYLAKTNYDLSVAFVSINESEIDPVGHVTGVSDGTTVSVFYDTVNYPTPTSVINKQIKSWKNPTTLVSSGAPAVLRRSVSLASKAFFYNSVPYMLTVYPSDYQSTYFLIEGNDGQVASKIAPLVAGGIAAKNVIPQVNTISNGVYQIAYLEKLTANAVDGKITSQRSVTQATLDFTSVGLVSTELASSLHIGGGFLAQYDGLKSVEHGFHLWPESVTCTQTAGGAMVHGPYQYVAVYEWTDLQGNIHRSAPSLPTAITLSGAHNSVTVVVPTLRLTAKSSVVINIYRTLHSGSIFYRVTSLTSPLLNNTAVDTVSFIDTQADSSIIGNNQLYTTGGIVENVAAPASEIFTSFKNRIILVPAEAPNQFWYSKEVVPGVPVEFSDVFVNNIDQYGGDIRAIGVLDDKIVLFKENTKFFVYGDGPAANGAGGAWSFSERITSDTGCVNQRSIVSSPAGLFYQSPKGIYLLQRSLTDQYIGSAVEKYTKDAQVTSALLIADSQQIRMTLDSGVTIVYDYFMEQWSVDTGILAQDSTLFQGARYAIVRADGKVMLENPTHFCDDEKPILMKVRTGWINFAQVQGFQRVYKMLLLGEYYSPHQLIVRFAENFNDNAHQETYINASVLQPQLYGDDYTYGDSVVYGGEFPSYNFRVYLSRQKGTSLQVTLEESQTAHFGEGFSLSNIAFEVGIKRGLNKLKAGASYG